VTALKIGIIVGTTRPGRHAEAVAKWVLARAEKRKDAQFEIVDIADFHLPLLDEPVPPSAGKYSKDHTKAWAAKIGSLDGFIFVTPEYQHSVPGSLKNALDFLYAEWNNKAAAIVSYGSIGGARAAEHLRGILAELQVAHVRQGLLFSLFDDFVHFQEFKPRPIFDPGVEAMFDQLLAWSGAMRTLRP
jgi:NAD(P)H-dependent FMN reductase